MIFGALRILAIYDTANKRLSMRDELSKRADQ